MTGRASWHKAIQAAALWAAALLPVVACGAVDFTRPGSLAMNCGAFADGGEQIAFSPGGATVRLDATRVKAGQGVYYSIVPRDAGDEEWANRRVAVFVRFHKPVPVLSSLSIDLMGNRTEPKGTGGAFAWPVGENPSAIVLENATRAEIRYRIRRGPSKET